LGELASGVPTKTLSRTICSRAGSNWRSHDDLVRIQHVIASQIDRHVERPQARAEVTSVKVV